MLFSLFTLWVLTLLTCEATVFHAHDFESLQQSIAASNSQVAATIIVTGTISISAALPDITSPVSILGSSPTASVLQCSTAVPPAAGETVFGALKISSGGVSLSNLTIQGCQATALVIDAQPSAYSGVTFSHCSFVRNSGFMAGAIEVRATWQPAMVTFESCDFQDNMLLADDGSEMPANSTGASAILAAPGSYSMTACTFTNNGAAAALATAASSMSAVATTTNATTHLGCTGPFCNGQYTSTAAVHFDWSQAPLAWAMSLADCDRQLADGSAVAALSVSTSLCAQGPKLNLDVSGCSFRGNVASGQVSVVMPQPDYFVAAAVLSVHTGLQTGGGCSVSIKDSAFESNVGGTVSVFGDDNTASCSVDAATSHFDWNVGLSTGMDTPSGGMLVAVNQASFAMSACNVSHNRGSNTAVFLMHVSVASVAASRFRYNQAQWCGGAVYAYDLVHLELLDCLFVNNTALQGGGAVSLDIIISIAIRNCTFEENYSSRHGGAVSVDSSNTLVANSTFLRNTAQLWGGGLYMCSGRYTTLQHLNFTSNGAFVGGGLVFEAGGTYQSTNVSDSTFYNNSAESAGAVIIWSNRHGHTFTRCRFLYNSAVKSVAQDTWLNRQSSINVDACGSGGGGAICASASAWVILNQCDLIGNTATFGGALHTTNGVDCPWGLACYVMEILLSNVHDNVAYGGAGGAIFAQYDKCISIVCDKADGGHDEDVMLLHDDYASEPADYTEDYVGSRNSIRLHKIPCTSWRGNRAVDGAYGDVVATPVSWLALQTPSVVRRYSSTTALDIQVTALDYYGQVVSSADAFVAAEARATSACTTYSQVSAANINGTIHFTDLRLRADAGRCNVTLLTMSNNAARSFQLAPLSVMVEVRDCIVGQASSPQGDQCNDCPTGFYSVDGNSTMCRACPDGATCSTSLQVNVTAGSKGSDKLIESALTSIATNKALGAECSASSNRTSIGAVTSCVMGIIVPKDGYWHSHPFSTQVHACRAAAACTWAGRDGALAAVQAAIAHGALELTSVDDYQAVMCADGHVGNLCAQCAPGYGQNPRCGGDCEQCLSEAVNTLLYVVASLFSFWIVSLVVALTIMTSDRVTTAFLADANANFSNDSSQPGAPAAAAPPKAGGGGVDGAVLPPMPQELTACKVLLSYLQVLSLLRFLPGQWPSFVQVFFVVTGQLSSMTWGVVSLECSLSSSWSRKSQIVLIAVLSPLYTCAAMAVFWLGAAGWLKWRRKIPGRMSRYIAHRLLLSCVVVLFYCYPSVAATILAIFSCQTLDTPDSAQVAGLDYGYDHSADAVYASGSFWKADLDMQCFAGEHMTLVWVVGVPGLILFVIGVPLAAAVWLLHCRMARAVTTTTAAAATPAATAAASDVSFSQQSHSGRSSSHTAHERVFDPTHPFPSAALFLYQDYTPACRFWELMVTARKLVLIAIIVFISMDSGLKIMLMQGVLAIVLILEFLMQPFASGRMHRLERLELFAVICTLYVILFFSFIDSSTVHIALGLLLVIGNSTVAAYITFCAVYEFVAAILRYDQLYHLSADKSSNLDCVGHAGPSSLPSVARLSVGPGGDKCGGDGMASSPAGSVYAESDAAMDITSDSGKLLFLKAAAALSPGVSSAYSNLGDVSGHGMMTSNPVFSGAP